MEYTNTKNEKELKSRNFRLSNDNALDLSEATVAFSRWYKKERCKFDIFAVFNELYWETGATAVSGNCLLVSVINNDKKNIHYMILIRILPLYDETSISLHLSLYKARKTQYDNEFQRK